MLLLLVAVTVGFDGAVVGAFVVVILAVLYVVGAVVVVAVCACLSWLLLLLWLQLIG